MARRGNLVFVNAEDGTGQIVWNAFRITPYTFAATFLQSTGTLSYRESVDKDLGFIIDKKLSEKALKNLEEEMRNPLLQIEIRKHGLVLGGLFSGLWCYRDAKGQVGYLFDVPGWQRKYLDRAGVNYKLVEE